MNQMERDLPSLALDDKLELEDNSDEEFSFVCANPDDCSSITADDAFFNGQIRPVYPLFNRDLLFPESSDDFENPSSPLRKVFVENEPETALEEGTYCEWSPATAELVKKSNSTGFSKLRRFRDFMTMNRSSSDGKDAFVFLTNPSSKNAKNATTATATETAAPKVSRVKVKAKTASSSSAHETHYIKSRAQKQVSSRRSYLPYRQDLVGFFTTANGFTKNVHPF